MKLHIGCAEIRRNGYINIDVRKTPATDVVTEAWNLKIYNNNSIDEIYTRHMFEHLDPNEARVVLSEWSRVLKDNGVLHIIVPDLIFHCKQLLERASDPKELNHALCSIYGWRDERRGGSIFDAHKWGYTKETLIKLIKEYGFTIFEKVTTGKDTEPWHLNYKARKK